jgi:peptidoglycan hydrolase CwlO-like protein
MKQQMKKTDTMAEKLSKWIGSTSSLILHTILFVSSFILILLGMPSEKVLLFLTTIVSLEAIYLAIFIQMTVNRNTARLDEVGEDLGEIQEDIDEIQEDVDEIQEDVDEIQEDVDDIQEDVDADTKRDKEIDHKFKNIEETLSVILAEIKKK